MSAVAFTAPHAPFSLLSISKPSTSGSSRSINFDLASCFRARLRRRKRILNAASSAGAVELGFREIQEKCSQWQWKGHTVTYLVVHPPQPQPRSTNPPLLLVHGFGASIAHWRRFSFACYMFLYLLLPFPPNLFIAPNVYLLFLFLLKFEANAHDSKCRGNKIRFEV